MQFAPNFPLERLVFSETAERLGIDNTLPPDFFQNAVDLSWRLEAIEGYVAEQWGAPLILTSAYRCPALNHAVGGSRSSAHLEALAADIKVVGVMPQALAALMVDSFTSGDFDQIIHEFTWVHVAIPRQGMVGRGQLLTAYKQNGRIAYREGLL